MTVAESVAAYLNEHDIIIELDSGGNSYDVLYFRQYIGNDKRNLGKINYDNETGKSHYVAESEKQPTEFDICVNNIGQLMAQNEGKLYNNEFDLIWDACDKVESRSILTYNLSFDMSDII